jgi:hypothetical protein
MSTLEEITNDKHLNRLYWNELIKFNIVLIRQFLKQGTANGVNMANAYNKGLQSKLESRSTFKYHKDFKGSC